MRIRQILSGFIFSLLALSSHASTSPACERSEKAGASKELVKKELQNLHYIVNQKVHTFEGIKEHQFEQTPTTGIRVKSGWLVGSNRGEFGGELAFISDTGSKEILLNDNIHKIYNVNNSLFVVAGLSHLLSSSGTIYKITINPSAISHTVLHKLDGAPTTSFLTQSGHVMIETDYSTVLLSPNGSVQKISCNSAKSQNRAPVGAG